MAATCVLRGIVKLRLILAALEKRRADQPFCSADSRRESAGSSSFPPSVGDYLDRRIKSEYIAHCAVGTESHLPVRSAVKRTENACTEGQVFHRRYRYMSSQR